MLNKRFGAFIDRPFTMLDSRRRYLVDSPNATVPSRARHQCPLICSRLSPY